MKKLTMLFGFGALLFMAAPAHAGKINGGELVEMGEDAMQTKCAKDISAKAGDVGDAWKNMRSACKALRSCKRDCRKTKRAAKKDCRKLKGKAKRDCKRDARIVKKGCAADCRTQYKDNGCKAARRAFWQQIADVAKASGKQCFNDAKGFFNGG